jgi:aspartate/methionine/tyrosine aminotransferase
VNRIPAAPDDVHMIPGTMFAIFLVCYYFLKPGDEALISPAPVYPPFIHNVLNAGAVPVFNPLDFQNGAGLDLDDLKSRITPRTRMLMVCNPHNPTGRVLTLEELEGVARVAQEHDLLIFADELYEDMLFEGEHISIASLSEELYARTITVFGFSKAFGMPGYRIAYITTRSKYKKELKHRIHDMIVHADTLAQAAARAALTQGKTWLSEFMSHLKKMRDYGFDRLSGMQGLWCLRPQATPFLFPNISSFGMTSREMCEYLRDEAKVIVMDGAEFGPPGRGSSASTLQPPTGAQRSHGPHGGGSGPPPVNLCRLSFFNYHILCALRALCGECVEEVPYGSANRDHRRRHHEAKR